MQHVIINFWNSLPQGVVMSASINGFQRGLDIISWKRGLPVDISYDGWKEPTSTVNAVCCWGRSCCFLHLVDHWLLPDPGLILLRALLMLILKSNMEHLLLTQGGHQQFPVSKAIFKPFLKVLSEKHLLFSRGILKASQSRASLLDERAVCLSAPPPPSLLLAGPLKPKY